MPRFTVRVYRLGNSPMAPVDFSVDHLARVGEMTEYTDGPTLVYNDNAVAVMLVTPTGEAPVVAKPALTKPEKATDGGN